MAEDNIATGPGDPSHPVLQLEQTLAIVLGASEWPYYPDFHAAASFRRSALAIVDYLHERDGLHLPRHNMKVIIDSFDDAPEILLQMGEFIRRRRADLVQRGTPATDLLFYYIGHGGFADGDNAPFFLSIRSTNEADPLATSIAVASLGHLIRETANGLRTYLVLDCCFAASASKVFMSGGPLGVAGAQLHEALPPRGDSAAIQVGKLPEYGIALLCASGPREPAKAPADLPYTMFTGGLLDVLRDGDPSAPAWLSFDDMQRLVRARLEAQFDTKAVLPQVHAPQQRMGRVDLVPLFRNPARHPPPLPTPIEAESAKPARAHSETLVNTGQFAEPSMGLVRTLTGHGQRISCIATARDGITLASGCSRVIFVPELWIWDISSGEVRTRLTGHTTSLWSLAFSPDGTILASGASDGLRLWSVPDGKPLRTLSLGRDVTLLSVTFSPDGATLAAGSNEPAVRLWSQVDGKWLRVSEERVSEEYESAVRGVAFSPDGTLLASASGSLVRIERVLDWESVIEIPTPGETRGLHSTVAFSPDGALLAVGAQLWRVSDWKLLRTLEADDFDAKDVKVTAFSPDSAILATISAFRVKLWRVADGKLLSELPQVNLATHEGLAWSPDGSRLIISSDKTIQIWSWLHS